MTGRGENDLLVVLIHGLGRTAASMWPLEWRLRRAGFAVRRVGYPSTRAGVAASVVHVRAALEALAPARRLALVGHSLGGLIAARLLRDPQGLRIAWVVQLGSPNRGSTMARLLGGLWGVRDLTGPAMAELGAPFERPAPDPRIAAIAGTIGWPVASLAWPNDCGVTVRSAWSGAGHRAAVPVIHTLLPASARVARLVVDFLCAGRFAGRARGRTA